MTLAVQTLSDLTDVAASDAIDQIEAAGFRPYGEMCGGHEFRHPDGSVIRIGPSGEVIRLGAMTNDGHRYRYDQCGERTAKVVEPLVRVKRHDDTHVVVRFNSEASKRFDLGRYDRIVVMPEGSSVAFGFTDDCRPAYDGTRSYSLQHNGSARLVFLGRAKFPALQSGVYALSGSVDKLSITPVASQFSGATT